MDHAPLFLALLSRLWNLACVPIHYLLADHVYDALVAVDISVEVFELLDPMRLASDVRVHADSKDAG